jgi:TonB family protein
MTSKHRFFILALLLPITVVASEDNAPSAQQLIDEAHKVSNLTALGPYILNATVTTSPGTDHSQTGHLRIYRDQDRARLELRVGDKTDTQLDLGYKRYVSLSEDLPATSQLAWFDRAWDPAPRSDPFHTKSKLSEVTKDKVRDSDAWCFERAYGLSVTRYCVDPNRSVLLQSENKKTRMAFFDYSASGGVMWPQRVEVSAEDGQLIEVSQIEIAPADLPAEAFAVPKDTMEFEICENRESPQGIYTPQPEYSAKPRRTVTLSVLVTKEGKVGAVHLLTPVADSLDVLARDIVKTWRFKPAACQGHPVNTWLGVSINYK